MKKRNKNSAKSVKAFQVMAKPIGPICNLHCRYYFYLEKENLYGRKRDWAMPDAVLESYVSKYITAQDAQAMTFAWHGGEPTFLGVDFFRQIVAIQKKYANGKKIENAFQTNGVLLDDRWGEFLAQSHFLNGISLTVRRNSTTSIVWTKASLPPSTALCAACVFSKSITWISTS